METRLRETRTETDAARRCVFGRAPRAYVGSRRELDGVRAMVVAADATDRESLRIALRLRGARVATAASARDAVTILEEATPDVIVCSVPDADAAGLRLLGAVRAGGPARSSQVPAIAIVRAAGRTVRTAAESRGYQACLGRPVGRDGLVRLVARLARGGR